MLVVSRKTREQIIIRIPERDEPIVITTLLIDRNQVRICIDADSDILINREEVYARMEVAA